MNKHKCRTWAASNPFIAIKVTANSPKVNVRCALSNNPIVGRYFVENETVNRQNYHQMFKNEFYPILQRKGFNNKINFQEDGMPSHFFKEVRPRLNEKFNGKWIGSDDSVSWAVYSTDLMILDYFSMQIH